MATSYVVLPADARHLIRRAETHELGVQFVREGSLDAVCATFGVHAFVVESARDLLSRSPSARSGDSTQARVAR